MIIQIVIGVKNKIKGNYKVKTKITFNQ
jgi:hypothetical protein